MTDPLGQSQVIPYLIGLSKKGYIIHLISCEKKKNYFESEGYISEIFKENNICWHPLSYSKTPPILSTLWDLFRINNKAFSLHKKEKFLIVHCRSYIASLIGLKMKKKFGQLSSPLMNSQPGDNALKFIFDMRGFWVDERVEGKLWNLQNPVFKIIFHFFKKKEMEFLSFADYIVTLTYSAKNEITTWNIPELSPIEVIPCCVDMELFSPEKIIATEKKKLKRQLKFSEEDFVISYLGAIGTWYLLDEMLQFFKLLLKSNPKARFLFITSEKPESILNKVVQLKIPKEKIAIYKASRKEVPQLLNLSKLSIFFIMPSFSKTASSPTKLGEIMAMGIPIISNEGIGDVGQIIENSKSGILVRDFNKEEYDHIICSLPELLSKDSVQIINAAQKYFSLEKGVNSYNEIYQNLLSK